MPITLQPGWTFNQKRTRYLLAQSGTRCRFVNGKTPKLYLYVTPKAKEYYPNEAQWMLQQKICVISPEGVQRDTNIIKSLHGKFPATW